MTHRNERPNILMIMTDQQRFDSLGCYAPHIRHTPNLDQLAEDGVLFENCYVNNPICTPSRASIFTGKTLPGHGVYRLHDRLDEQEVLFTRRLQDLGYETALFGKLHVGARVEEGLNRHPHDGFDIYENALDPYTGLHSDKVLNASYVRWLQKRAPEVYQTLKAEGRKFRHFPEALHYTHWAAERTMDYLENRRADKPFFVCMSLFDPHDPYIAYPMSMLDKVKETPLPEPIKGADPGSKPDGVKREHAHSYLGDYDQFTPDDIRKMRLGYHAAVAFIDQKVGDVLNALKRQGLYDRTLIIFVSDHGDMLGDHRLLAKGAFFYDACTKVPLIMRFPGRNRKGIRVKDLVQPHDLAATILHAAGYDRDELRRLMPDSLNLLDLDEEGRLAEQRDFAVCMYRNSGVSDAKVYFNPPIHATMIRDRRYKLNVYHHHRDEPGSPRGELFDMMRDPNEEQNLWDDPNYQQVKMNLLFHLMDWMVQQDVRYTGSRAGEVFPDRSQWSLNNAL